MEKIKVNNQVVSMRKFVKQAKIHAINKCTKQIKFLENRKGSEEQIAKTKRKHQRLLDEVNLLKKIKPDSVSKVALSKAKDWKAVLAEKNVPLEERCFAMLANHPPVLAAVEKFHNDNCELIAKIPELVKEWEGKKSRSSQIYKKKQKANKNSATGPNSIPIGNKKDFQKSSEAQIKHQSSEILEGLLDKSDLKNAEKDLTEQKVAIEEKTTTQEASDNLDPSSITSDLTEKKLLVVNNKVHASDNSLSDGSDFEKRQNNPIKKKSPIESKPKNNQFKKNLKLSKVHAVIDRTNSIKMTYKKEALDNDDSNETKIKSNEEHTEKSQDIVSKLLGISMLNTKVQNKPKDKTLSYQHSNAETDDEYETSSDTVTELNDCIAKTRPSISTKPEVRNKIKAVTMLDLNELQDVDEIPIEKSDSEVEDETDEDSDSGKQKKDPFFLHDGEPVSESDEDDNAQKETARKREFPPFKKKPYGNFRDQKDNPFYKKKFEKHSENGRDSNFREQKDNSFHKKKFERHSEKGRNSNFRENNIKNRKQYPFKDNKQNFKRTFDGSSDSRPNKNFKFMSQDKFDNKIAKNNFTKNPEEKSFSQQRNAKRNSYPSNSNPSNPSKKNFPIVNKVDDKPLHPSWEAKRKLKEAANTKFQGKRMVFT